MKQGIKKINVISRVFGIVFVLCVLCIPTQSYAVVYDHDNQISVVLSDGTSVVLFGEAGNKSGIKTKNYYAMPVNLRVSTRADGIPEFLFLKFTTEQRADKGGATGALLHFLMEWGLTKKQEEELSEILDKKIKGAKLLGTVEMLPEKESGSFQIVSATLSDKSMTPSLISSGKSPIMPGAQAAVATRLNSIGAQLLDKTLSGDTSITDVSLSLNFMYQTLVPAAKGRVVMDWSKYEKSYDKIKAQYEHKKKKKGWWIFGSTDHTYSYDEMSSHYDSLVENKVIDFQFDELVADERVAKIREAFLQLFLNSFSDAADKDARPVAPSDKEKEQNPNIKQGKQYKFSKTFTSRSFKKKKQVFNLNYRMAIKRPFQLVGNLRSWYEGVRDCKQCIVTTIMNDPFFSHRDIRFILDLDAKEIFDETINFVTVNVRKRRSSGRDFEDSIVFDAEYLKKHGISAGITYARGGDKDPSVYEYKTQWSLRGGNIYPRNARWKKGDWEGVTLDPPLVPRTIEIESDLDELKASEISRVTVQVHYSKLGKEVEDNIHISPAKGEALVSKKIFIDKDAKGYAYRLVLNHKKDGKLALPWSAQVGDDYIYASIPSELFEKPAFKEEAKKAARNIRKSVEEKVLNKFEELF